MVAILSFGMLGACKQKAAQAPVPQPVAQEPPPGPNVPPAPTVPELPLGLPELELAEDVALTPEKVALGKQLFFDKRLSPDGAANCETCHQHDKGWTDGLALSPKVNGKLNTRHTPTLYNTAFHPLFYWDGRAPTLDAQIMAAWKGQMSGEPEKVAALLTDIPLYKVQFEKAFGTAPTADTIVAALAAYIRTVLSGNSAWDRHEKGEQAAVNDDVVAGWKVFRDKAHCTLCHVPPFFSDMLFHNVGIGTLAKEPDEGRFAVTKDPKDMNAIKTPTLRSVTKSGPYFHDGSVATLEDAVKLMLAGGLKNKNNKNLDARLKPVKLSDKEFKQLMAFITALESTEELQKPTLP